MSLNMCKVCYKLINIPDQVFVRVWLISHFLLLMKLTFFFADEQWVRSYIASPFNVCTCCSLFLHCFDLIIAKYRENIPVIPLMLYTAASLFCANIIDFWTIGRGKNWILLIQRLVQEDMMAVKLSLMAIEMIESTPWETGMWFRGSSWV